MCMTGVLFCWGVLTRLKDVEGLLGQAPSVNELLGQLRRARSLVMLLPATTLYSLGLFCVKEGGTCMVYIKLTQFAVHADHRKR